MFALLSDAEITQATPAHRFMVEVASNTHDHEDISLDVRTVDLSVSAPTKEAIATLIAGTPWLNGYSLVNYWLPEDGYKKVIQS